MGYSFLKMNRSWLEQTEHSPADGGKIWGCERSLCLQLYATTGKSIQLSETTSRQKFHTQKRLMGKWSLAALLNPEGSPSDGLT